MFPPTLREPPPPALDQFDLDEHFASEALRLAQLTNKCSDDDLEYYVKESADILGILPKLDPERNDAKHILEFIFHKIVNFKKLNQEAPAAAIAVPPQPSAAAFGNGNSMSRANSSFQKSDRPGLDDDDDGKTSTP